MRQTRVNVSGDLASARRALDLRAALDAAGLRFVPTHGRVAPWQVDTSVGTGGGNAIAPCPVGAITLAGAVLHAVAANAAARR